MLLGGGGNSQSVFSAFAGLNASAVATMRRKRRSSTIPNPKKMYEEVGVFFPSAISQQSKYLPPANEVWDKVMFLHLSVLLFSVGVSAPLHAGIHPPPLADPPDRHPPPYADTPLGRHPSPRYYRIWSTSGRYASYWNAYLSRIVHILSAFF